MRHPDFAIGRPYNVPGVGTRANGQEGDCAHPKHEGAGIASPVRRTSLRLPQTGALDRQTKEKKNADNLNVLRHKDGAPWTPLPKRYRWVITELRFSPAVA
jgi:hypothetical protein